MPASLPETPRPFQNVSLVMEVEQRCVIKFFVEEGMKKVEVIDRLNTGDDRGALQRAEVDTGSRK
jgi:hypothetical protein